MIDVILSHLAAFALGGVVMAQLLQLNRRPHPPRLPLNEDKIIYVQCLSKALLHIMEASRWVSCAPHSEDHLPTFMASLEQMLRRRIDAYQRQLQQLSDPALGQAWSSTTTTPEERHGHY